MLAHVIKDQVERAYNRAQHTTRRRRTVVERAARISALQAVRPSLDAHSQPASSPSQQRFAAMARKNRAMAIRIRRRICILAALVVIAAAPAPALDMPDPAATPGATNPDITQTTIDTTICHPGWSTRSIRPLASYTDALKRRQLADPRYTDKAPADYEEDHLISLEIGGAPRDPRNLWPEAYAGPCGARVKDRLEDKLHTLVCNGTLILAEAQQAISSDWEAAYRRYVGPLVCGNQLAAEAYAQTPGASPASAISCPGDKIVWVNTSSGVYHYQGERYFGRTKNGKFACERDALHEGDRAAGNGQ